MREQKGYCVALGRDRKEVEAYLYGGNEIAAEYERAGSFDTYVAVLECAKEGGFGVSAQAQRLASGTRGGHVEFADFAGADDFARERLGARLVRVREEDVAGDGPRSRLSALAEESS